MINLKDAIDFALSPTQLETLSDNLTLEQMPISRLVKADGIWQLTYFNLRGSREHTTIKHESLSQLIERYRSLAAWL